MRLHRVLFASLLVLICVTAFAQEPSPSKKNLTPDDYAKWERLGAVDISNDGKWVLANISRVEADPFLIVRSSDGSEKWTEELGSRGTFSEDSKYVVFTLVMPREKAEALRKQKKRVENKMGVLNLAGGTTAVFESVASWRLVKGTSKLVILRYAAESAGKAGGDCEIFDLSTGNTTPVGNVKEFEVHSENGLVALHTVSPTDNEGIVVINCNDMKSTTVAWAKMHFGSMTWAEKADALAFISGEEKEGKDGDWTTIGVARGLLNNQMEQAVFDPKKMDGFPEGMRIVESSGLRVRKDGTSISFGVNLWKDKEKGSEKKDDVPGVEIWNTKDVDPMPLQSKTAARDRNRATQYLWSLSDGTFKSFAEPELENLRLSPDHSSAVAWDMRPYESPVKVNGLEYTDVILIDLVAGTRKNLLTKVVSNAFGVDATSLSYSPGGGYAIHFDGKDWILHNLKSSMQSNLTKGLGVPFLDREDDHTLPKPPAGGNALWMQEDGGLILHGDHDAFLFDLPSGKSTRLTEGEKDKVRYRILDAGYHEDGIFAGDPLYFSVFDTVTKESGVARWTKEAGLKLLIAENARLTWAARSKDSDRVLFVHQTFESSPTAYLTNLEFSAAKPVVNTNKQQEEYLWGRTNLVSYKALGRDLQGVLIYPANYEDGKKYPMVTYVYERLSDGFHSYQVPSNTDSYNEQHFSQTGYFVFMPDIAYKDRQPGVSAVKCIEAGLKAVFALNVGVDPTKVGLTGHSWGGYETVFVATQSKMFAAYVAGAPLTELLSMYNGFYWNSGQSNQVIFEVSQGRMEVPWWEDTKSYIENSPLFHAGDIRAPMLVEVGTVDGAVDWHQGIYLYSTLRRMGKEMVMLVYANENHGLAVPANQKDYAMRARHFFDVHLKGAKPDKWLDKGVPFIELGEELKPKEKKEGDGKTISQK